MDHERRAEVYRAQTGRGQMTPRQARRAARKRAQAVRAVLAVLGAEELNNPGQVIPASPAVLAAAEALRVNSPSGSLPSPVES